MPRAIKKSEFHTDMTPYLGIPILVIHFLLIGTYFAAEYYLFPLIDSEVLTDALKGGLNPVVLVLSFYLACLIYLFTRDDERKHFRLFTLSALGLAVIGTVFNIYLPEVSVPDEAVPRFFMALLGAGLGTFTCIFYRNVFCGKIEPLL